MKIVLLDGGAVNPGDLSWEGLKALAEDVEIYDYSRPEEILPRLEGCQLLITNKVNITREIMDAVPTLEAILVTATGFNNIDIGYAREKGIPVCNVPAYSSDSVAQLVFALLLEMVNQVAANNASVQRGEWKKARLYTYPVTKQTELAGKTFGILGFGHIGRRVAQLAHAFGMEVIVHNRTQREAPDYIRYVELDTLLRASDVLTLHTALAQDNKGIIGRQAFEKMKPTALLINTARGGLIDEAALVQALEQGEIAGAALDVITTEPMEQDSPLLGVPNLILTPHIAWTTVEARSRLIGVVVDNARAFLAGKPQNVINF